MEEPKELQDSSTPEPEQEPEQTPEDSVETPPVEETKAEPKKDPSTDKLYARAKKAEEENKELKEKLAAKKEVPSASNPKGDLEERVDLRIEGYSNDEIAFIKRAQKPGENLAETAKNPYVKFAVEGMRSKAKVEQATPDPSSRAVQPGGKTFGELKQNERAQHYGFKAWQARKKSKV